MQNSKFSVQSRAELTAFLCLLRNIGPTMNHVDNKGIFDGERRHEMQWFESNGHRHVDAHSGRTAWSSPRLHIGGS